MGKSELRVDTHVLITAGSTLKKVSDEFGEAGRNAREAASQVGYPPLARAIREFADKWDDKRKALKETIDALATAATQIAEEFGDTDEELKRVLDAELCPPQDPEGDNCVQPPNPVQPGPVQPGPVPSDPGPPEDPSPTPGEPGESPGSDPGSPGSGEGSDGDGSDPAHKDPEQAFKDWRDSVLKPTPGDKPGDHGHGHGDHGHHDHHGPHDHDHRGGLVRDYVETLFGKDTARTAMSGERGQETLARFSPDYFTQMSPSSTPQPGDIICIDSAGRNGRDLLGVVDSVNADGSIQIIGRHENSVALITLDSEQTSHIEGYLRPNPDKII